MIYDNQKKVKDMMNLEEELTRLEDRRTLLVNDKNVLKGFRDEFEKKHNDFIQKIRQDAEDVSETETAIRKLALEDFAKNKDRDVGFGVKVKIMTRYDYDKATAFAWAKKHEIALRLDDAAFKKIAQVQDIDFVKVSEVPSATIPTDIAKELAKSGGSVKDGE